MAKREINKLLSSLRVPFAIVANIESGQVERFGDPASIMPADLIKSLFGDAPAIKRLYDSFEGRLKPYSMRQGDVAVVLCTPKPGLIVGLFCIVTLAPLEYYLWTKDVSDAIDAEWN